MTILTVIVDGRTVFDRVVDDYTSSDFSTGEFALKAKYSPAEYRAQRSTDGGKTWENTPALSPELLSAIRRAHEFQAGR